MVLSGSTVETAISKGVDYLSRIQRQSGEFTTYSGPSLDLSDATPYPKSVYVTTFVVHSLGFLAADPRVERIRSRAANFLEAEEEAGVWNYEGRGVWRLPPDLDSTCCAAAALIAVGRRPPTAFYSLLWGGVRRNEVAPGGPYYTYIGVNDVPDDPDTAPFAGEVDSLVNANIVFCCGLMGIDLPGATDFLRRLVQTKSFVGHSLAEGYPGRTPPSIPPHFVIYTIARAYADGRASGLDTAMPSMREFLLVGLPEPRQEPAEFNLACRAVSLLNLGANGDVIAPFLAMLLDAQHPDGHWPVWAAWVGFPPNFDGSPALTTALALEALGKWQNRGSSRRRVSGRD
jgi:hypothetical protein